MLVRLIYSAEPMKKKRRLDPAIVRAREDRKKRKLEKQIRRKERGSRQLKPIDECEVPEVLLKDDKKWRVRQVDKLSEQEVIGRVRILKAWAGYKQKQALRDIRLMDRIMFSQQHALDELRKESEFLYQEAIKVDENLINRPFKGPLKTPPIENYASPDGEYIDTTKKW
ncbi:39S ribosomal protein L40, mitochondrial isoform X2 [Nilaparvata lugens]|uniref:39S ribosomal protein L40, mitochondrial isoform X2 n=1 Tax=Nilaparvata lugens TaxID=108931 RepID=UPI00193CF4D7|nr:39S ribosomal protein L40, mitochondrial isoform X2 [Nilaparvata lugens]